MQFKTLLKYFTDVTESAKASYIYNAQHDFVDEQPDNHVGTEVVYHYLKQFYDHDELTDENDVVEFGVADVDGLIQLVDNLLDNSHIYLLSDELYQQLGAYYDRFGINFERIANNITSDYTPDNHHYLLVNNSSLTADNFRKVLNTDLFGGYSSNTHAIDTFLSQV